jgi:hypothetical protein
MKYKGIIKSKYNIRRNTIFIKKFLKVFIILISRKNLLYTRHKFFLLNRRTLILIYGIYPYFCASIWPTAPFVQELNYFKKKLTRELYK